LFVCFVGGGVSLQSVLCWFILGVMARGTPHDTWCSPVSLLDVSQAGLEPVSGSAAVLLFSQCNMVWRNFPWAGVQGVEVLIVLAALFPPSVAPALQQCFRVTELILYASAPQLPSWIS
jgi:hypothetical protein